MPIITIDDRPFELDALSEEAKQQLGNLTACDQEIGRLNVQLAIAQTARSAYARALQEALPKH
jgi:hypothetical protein